MIAIKGIYDGKTIKPLVNIPVTKPTNVLITFMEERLSSDEEMIRNFSSLSDAFGFWEDEREDLYQDYLKKE